MLFAQVVTLFLTPAIYLYAEELQRRVLDRIPFLRRGQLSGDGEGLPQSAQKQRPRA
jgi:hypothetical protein